MKIAIDAMGGDFAPQATVEGAVMAVKAYQIPVTLVGRETDINKELAKYDVPRDDVPSQSG
jgi:glycerol-3-phosphate acyltransferase PlsX